MKEIEAHGETHMKKLGPGLLINLIPIAFGSKEDTKKLKKKEVLDVAMRLYSLGVEEKSVGTDNLAIDDNNSLSATLCDVEECNSIFL